MDSLNFKIAFQLGRIYVFNEAKQAFLAEGIATDNFELLNDFPFLGDTQK